MENIDVLVIFMGCFVGAIAILCFISYLLIQKHTSENNNASSKVVKYFTPYNEEEKFNIWHDIGSDRILPEDFIAVIEIGKGSKNKYELDKETGMLILDRVLYTSTHYPANYGFIPRTYAGDDDPLDVLVLCSETIHPMSLVRCYPIGVMRMKDGDCIDDKIIAIPKNDPSWNHIKSINDLSKHIMDEIVHFYSVYKQLEHKQTTILSILDTDDAKTIIAKAIKTYEITKNSK